ncbi:unnamed protein product [Ostreobium quekettii]|uniref:ABC transporter domain-containing protein n=1 Tax=Ostreobium quekettii TaxID=121088 RepID=A0A8S1IWN1_9CHLO|nr:unnamed protein product [Ostreobium quekettii]|eukprot:evm.model.scf_181EXC.12 EVM.evm.TU.scf_181EXC.12   scf_181EXC:68687-78060(-)
MENPLKALSPSQKRVLAVVLLGGGCSAASYLGHEIAKAQAEQKELAADLEKSNGRKKSRIAVDRVFARRLLRILSICIPSPFSKEALLVLFQGGLLFSRTLLTLRMSRSEGKAGRALVTLELETFWREVLKFGAIGIPAALVNAGLKYMQKYIQQVFQERVTKHLHLHYCSNRAYYAASTLGGLTLADQRITEDVEKFADAISELYSYTLKPLLDVVLFTRALAPVMGYQTQLGLYLYYVCTALILRSTSPPLAMMVAQESGLAGSFRSAHQRLVANAEEVAYNDPPGGATEQLVLNQHLHRLLRYTELSAFQRFVYKMTEGYLVKYFASCITLLVYAVPIYYQAPEMRQSQDQLTQDYIRAMRLLQNTSRGIGDLIMVYKRVTTLSGHTSRVSELLEQVEQLSSADAEHKDLFLKNISATGEAAGMDNLATGLGMGSGADVVAPRRLVGDVIKFHRLALNAPDGTPLIRELSFEVKPGQSVILMGPNGSGKSSLMRVLAGLWPLMAGEITTPAKHDMFYLSQKAYLVTGSLRDQLLYPDPPQMVWRTARREDKRHFVNVRGRAPTAVDDSRLLECLELVELGYLVTRGKGWEQVQKWEETLSGGEKQRIAMARLLFHRPKYAILDEATSAVSADGEQKLYEACLRADITLLSIAHRHSVKRFHSLVINFDGSQSGNGWSIEE